MRERWAESESLRTRPGVYAIYLDGLLTYIGASINVQARMGAHRKRFGNTITTKVSYDNDTASLKRRESRLLARLRPPANRALKSHLCENPWKGQQVEMHLRIPVSLVKELEKQAAENCRPLSREIAFLLMGSLA